ncbi:MAG: undecaprenyl-diphosphate phosphatase, partial [Stenotrophomonas sp.]
ENWTDVGVAFAAAVVTGFIVVKWLLSYIKRHSFSGFALYRIALGIGLLLFLPAGN